MIKKNILNIIIIFAAISICSFLLPMTVSANAGDSLLSKWQNQTSSWMSMGQNSMNSRGITINMTLIEGIGQFLYFTACTIIIAFTIFRAVRYGLSSPGERAAARRDLARWIIICIIVVAAYPIFKLIVSALDGSLANSSVVTGLQNVSQGITSASANSPVVMIINTIFRVIQVGGIGYIVIRLTVVGIRYFTLHVSARDPKTKAEVKAELVNTLILAVIIFGAVGFFEILYRAFN